MNHKFCGKGYFILTWGLIGIIVTILMCAVSITGTFSAVEPIYNCGDVYEIKEEIYKSDNVQEKGYQEKNGKVTLSQGEYNYGIAIEGDTDQWNYFCITVDEVNDQNIEIDIIFEVIKDNVIENSTETAYMVKDGTNTFAIPECSYNVVAIKILGDDGSSLTIKKIELREKVPFSGLKENITRLPLYFLAYVVVSGALIYCLKRTKLKFNIYSWIEMLQDIYILFAKQFAKVTGGISEGKRCYIRRICFLLIFLYSVFVEISQTYTDKFKYHVVIYVILLLLIACFSIEERIERKNWNNPLVWGWLTFGGLMCISDFLIPKDYRFWGYVLIIIIGFYTFVWNNMKDQSTLLQDFSWAVHVLLGLILIFCLIFRPEVDNMRYSGISKNPSIFALYLTSIWAVVLGNMENQIRFNPRLRFLLFYIVEGCVVLTFLWKTQSAGPLLCMAAISFIWLFRVYRFLRREKLRKILAQILLLTVFCIVPIFGGISWGVHHIPQTLNSAVSFDGETPVAKMSYGLVAQAADLTDKLEDTRLGQKFSNTTWSGILSGRNYYYKAYLRQMNLVGHKDRPIMWGHRRLPHNAIIGIAHRYGVFTVIPYIIMLIAVIERTFRYSRKSDKFASIPFYVCLSTIVMSMADNVEFPFNWLPWMGLYFLMGIVFMPVEDVGGQTPPREAAKYRRGSDPLPGTRENP